MLAGPRTVSQGHLDKWPQLNLHEDPRTTGPKYSRTQGLLGRAHMNGVRSSSQTYSEIGQVRVKKIPLYIWCLANFLLVVVVVVDGFATASTITFVTQ